MVMRGGECRTKRTDVVREEDKIPAEYWEDFGTLRDGVILLQALTAGPMGDGWGRGVGFVFVGPGRKEHMEYSLVCY